MLIEIFTSLIRDLLRMAGGSLTRHELVEEVAVELEETALELLRAQGTGERQAALSPRELVRLGR